MTMLSFIRWMRRLFWTVTEVTIEEFGRQYPSYAMLSLIFGTNEQYVSNIIINLVPYLALTSYRRHQMAKRLGQYGAIAREFSRHH